MKMSPPQHRAAFSLLEVLLAIAVLVVLIAITFAVLENARHISKRTACISNLRALHMTFNNYANDHQNCFPIGYGSKDGKPAGAWTGEIEEYLAIRPRFQINEVGITFCPATRTGGASIYKRNATTWLTDYNVNRFVCSAIESDNRRNRIPGDRIMLFDGQGGVSGSEATANPRHRHKDLFNIVFVDGSISTVSSFDGLASKWQLP